MKKRVLAILTAVIVFGSMAVGCGNTAKTSKEESPDKGQTNETVQQGEDSYNIKIGHVLAQSHPYQIGLEKFGELAAEKSGGKVKVDVFHSSTLGNERDMLEALQLGSQEMVLVSTAVLASFTDSFLVFDLPFLFETTEDARNVCDSQLGREILDSVKDDGFTGLVFFENGFRNVTNSKHPITKPEDLKGLKIRTMESPMHMAAFSAMGSDPTPMAMGELFTALQQKTIDGQENPLAIIDSSKLYEVQKYISLTGHFYAPAPLFISTSYYEALPEDIQTAIFDAAKEAQAYERQVLDDMNNELVTTLTDRGVEIVEVDKDSFIEAVSSVYTDWIGEGKGLVDPDTYERVMEMIKK